MTDMDTEQQDKATTRKRGKGITRKTMIIKNMSKGIKLAVKYNVDGVYVGQDVTPQIPGCPIDNPSTHGIPLSHIKRPIHE